MKKAACITIKGRSRSRGRFDVRWGWGPGDKLLFEKDGGGIHVRPVRTKSPFEKYRGIGTPGIARGKKGVVRWVRELREA